MEHRDFCYWLQGYLELTEVVNLNIDQINTIKQHLNLVLKKHPLVGIKGHGGLTGPQGPQGPTGAQC